MKKILVLLVLIPIVTGCWATTEIHKSYNVTISCADGTNTVNLTLDLEADVPQDYDVTSKTEAELEGKAQIMEKLQ